MTEKSKNTGKFSQWLTPAATVLFFVVFCLLILNYNKTDPEEIALMDGTIAIKNTTLAGRNIRNDIDPDPERWDYWKDLLPKKNEADTLIVWIGNSHLHAINGMQEGDQLSSYYLQVILNGEEWPGKMPSFGLSYPNLYFSEQFLLSLWLMLSPDLPENLIIVNGYRYHETRYKGIRPELMPIIDDPLIRKWIENNNKLEVEFPDAFRDLRNEMIQETVAEDSEKDIETVLRETIWDRIPILRSRDDINANLRLLIARLRKFVFRINTSTKRGVILSRYTTNMDFMKMTAFAARETGTRILMYNVPLRPGVESPFPEKEYDNYMAEMEKIGGENGETVVYRDYDSVIPQPDWGTFYTSGQPDYSHFKSSGHRILAEVVAKDLKEIGFLEKDNKE